MIGKGSVFVDVIQNNPDAWEDYQNDWVNFSFPNGDSVKGYRERAQRAIDQIVTQSGEDENIAIVSHNGFVKSALSYLVAGNQSLADRFSVQNATINWVEISDGETKLRLLNYNQRF